MVEEFYNKIENDSDPPVEFYMPYEDNTICLSNICGVHKEWQIEFHSESQQVYMYHCFSTVATCSYLNSLMRC